MDLQELQVLANNRVKVEISAADLLQVIESVVAKMSVKSVPQMVSMKEATGLYRKDRRTITKYIQDGIIYGEKAGGTWMVETPKSRAERMSA